MKYLVIDIGCIECGESTDIAGVFDSQQTAEQFKNKYVEDRGGKFSDYFNGGQHTVEVFEVETWQTYE